eukprot:GHUV01016320.1.p1 GENE.GHUV01016320.1~~GHUV01016320.1.p1  ORF type:complete len:530 (+),score=157.13 GHUV01016320.1:235-1824(+)
MQLCPPTAPRLLRRSHGIKPSAQAGPWPIRQHLKQPLGSVFDRRAVIAGSAAASSMSVSAVALEVVQHSPTVDTRESSRTTPQPAEQAQQSSEKFNWQQSWYPVAALTSLKSDAPNAVYLLGTRLVIWQDKQGTWRCFEDLCPHRLAPLSEGRIHESGQLQCTYHGWTFNEQGNCTSIPQIADTKAHQTACSSSRACVKAYPTQVFQDLLWVYADSSPPTWAAAAAGKLGLPPAASPDIVHKGWELKRPWFQRDVPLSFDVIMENLTDPAHVAHSHHGVIGSRHSDHRMDISLQGPVTIAGFKTLVTPAAAGIPPYEVTFTAPSLVRWERSPTLTLNMVPTRKGWSRIMVTFVGPKDSDRSRPHIPGLPPLVGFMLDSLDKHIWLQHIMSSNPVIDGDTLFMHAAERTLYERGDHTSWSKQYYMPATADVAVMAWRRWMDKFGDTLPVLPQSAADLPPTLPREQVFDRCGAGGLGACIVCVSRAFLDLVTVWGLRCCQLSKGRWMVLLASHFCREAIVASLNKSIHDQE